MIRWLYHKIKVTGIVPSGFRVLCAPCNIAMEPKEKICEYHKWLILKDKEEKQ